jgi:hypothetical protein
MTSEYPLLKLDVDPLASTPKRKLKLMYENEDEVKGVVHLELDEDMSI